jgi:hypothetical protein
MAKVSLIVVILLMSFTVQAQVSKNKTLIRSVPIRINIETDKNFSGDLSNVYFLQTKILDELRNVPRIDFVLAGVNEKPEAIIDIKVSNFFLGQRDEKTTIRTVTAAVEVGKDASNNAITQTVAANVQNVVVKRKASGNLESTITIDAEVPFRYVKIFPSLYNYSASTTSLSGDLRAVGNSFRFPQPGSIPPEPLENEFLFLLAKKDLLVRMMEEFKKYYQTQTKTAKVK